MCIDEFNGDNFDHGPLGFVGGGYMGQVQTGGRPIRDDPRSAGNAALGREMEERGARQLPQHGDAGHRRARQLLLLSRRLSRPRPDLSDRFGRPLMRMTIDFHDNEIKQNAFLTDQFAEIIKAMGAKEIEKQYRKAPYDVTKYQTTHLCGGAIMGTDPTTSALNRYLQSWDVPNLFVMGASAFPQNAGYNPTGTLARARLLVGRGDPDTISQEPGAARPCLSARAPDRGRRDRLVGPGGEPRRGGSRAGHGRNEPGPAEFRPDRAGPLPCHRRRLRELPHRAGLGQPYRGRTADRDAVRRRARRQHYARSRDRHRRLER